MKLNIYQLTFKYITICHGDYRCKFHFVKQKVKELVNEMILDSYLLTSRKWNVKIF